MSGIYYNPANSGFYNTNMVKYSNLPKDMIEITEEQYRTLLFEVNSNNKTIIVDSNNNISTVNRKKIEFTWDKIREIRNSLLSSSDFSQSPDYPGDKEAWRVYRQKLRDLPSEFTDPNDVIFPAKPTSK